MPSSVPVTVVLHGLIALVPLADTGGLANHVMALLVDARSNPADVKCFAPHIPRIRFPTSAAECTAVADDGCTWKGSACECILDGQEIELLPDTQPQKRLLDERPASSLPPDSKSASSFAYLGNLSQLGSPVDPAFKKGGPLPSALQKKIAARFRFPFDRLIACNLASRREKEIDYVHPLSFRRLHDPEKPSDASQALAQTVIAEVEVPLDTTAKQEMVLHLRPLAGGAGAERTFKIRRSPGVLIELSNDRRMSPSFENDPCDDGIGRDFAFFYELAENPPAWAERKVPHVKSGQGRKFEELLPDECKPVKDPSSRPVCPMGSSYP